MTKPADLKAHRLRVARLDGNQPSEFVLRPGAEGRDWLTSELELLGLPALSFSGTLRAAGREDWLLEARLCARVTQPCIITLTPVTTVIDEAVRRRFTPHMPEPGGEEVEMPEDDSLEPLPAVIDLAGVMTEALELALPLYPRAKGIDDPGAWSDEQPDLAPEDEGRKPFAGLADLLAARDGQEGKD